MGDYYRESRYRDYNDQFDDDRSSRTTVRRYKVKQGHDDHHEVVEVGDDYRPRHHHHRDDDYDDYGRKDRARSTVESYASRAPAPSYDDDRARYARQPDDVKVERRITDHWEDAHGHDVDHYRKETEYYTRPEPPRDPVMTRPRGSDMDRLDPGALVIRNRDYDRGYGRELARRDPRADEMSYYRDGRRERDMAMARYGRYSRDQGYSSDEDDRYTKHRVGRRERSESPPHHKRELAAGALAGAGITALLKSRRDEDGDLPEHRGRSIAAGGALGAIGTEALRRAHSAYGDRFRGGRESPDHHSTLKKGLGVAAVALAAAGAAKYYQSGKIEKEEAHRGRSRRRDQSRGYYDDYPRSASGKRTKSRGRSLSTAGKAALGAAATAGIVHHLRSKSRGKSRSKSKLRRAAEIGGAAAAAGVAGKVWSDHREKKKERESRERSLSYSSDDRDYGPRRGLNRSRSRSQAGSLRHTDLDSDPELGLVEYGGRPLSPSQRSSRAYDNGPGNGLRSRRGRGSSASDDASDGGRRRSRSRLRDMATAGAAAIGIKEFKDRKDQEKRDRRSRDRDMPRSMDRSRRRGGDADGYFGDHLGPPDRSGSPPVASGGGAFYPPYPATPGASASSGGYAQFPHAEPQAYVPQDYTGYPPPPAPGPPPVSQPPMGGFAPPGPPAPGPPPGPPNAARGTTPDNMV